MDVPISQCSSTTVTVVPTSGGLGAEIQGVDLSCKMDASTFSQVYEAWLQHSVLLFRGQHLTDDELITFSKNFGELDWAPVQETGRRFVEGKPEIYIVSNVIENGIPIGSLGAGEAVWHTDMSYLEARLDAEDKLSPRKYNTEARIDDIHDHIKEPPIGSILHALEVPPTGGNTWFINMYSVYEALSDDFKRRIDGLQIKHDGTYNSGGYLRQGVIPTDDPMTSPGAVHPLICIHPETKRRCLYLGRRRNGYIMGFKLDDSEALLDELWSYITAQSSSSETGFTGGPYSWFNEWKVGDLVLWDNRCTMHRRDAFDPNERRVMHRTQIKGNIKPSA